MPLGAPARLRRRSQGRSQLPGPGSSTRRPRSRYPRSPPLRSQAQCRCGGRRLARGKRREQVTRRSGGSPKRARGGGTRSSEPTREVTFASVGAGLGVALFHPIDDDVVDGGAGGRGVEHLGVEVQADHLRGGGGGIRRATLPAPAATSRTLWSGWMSIRESRSRAGTRIDAAGDGAVQPPAA